MTEYPYTCRKKLPQRKRPNLACADCTFSALKRLRVKSLRIRLHAAPLDGFQLPANVGSAAVGERENPIFAD